MACGLGPVFAWEWAAASRRWQGYALRSLVVTLLLVGLSGVWLGNAEGGGVSPKELAEVGRGFYAASTLILLGLVGLAAPAAAAGAVCVDKARGNLTLLFATDLSDAEVVLGKLAARLAPVVALVACSAPVLALVTLLGGVDPALPAGSALVGLACGVFGCTLALTLSVWGRRTHEVLLATYAFGLLYLLAAPVWAVAIRAVPFWARPGWLPGPLALIPYNPIFLVLGPLGAPAGTGPVGLGMQARFGALGLVASGVLAAAATWRIRAVVVRQADRSPRRVKLPRLMPAPTLDRDPVLWRECHRRRPSRWSVVVWGGFAAASIGFGLWAVALGLDRSRNGEFAAVIGGVQAAAGLLLLSVSAATSLAEERNRLDVLLATPLSTREIVLGKWRGAFRGVWPLAVLPTLIAATLATRTGFALGPALIGGLVIAYGAAITSLGLALATWLPRMDRAIGLTAGLYVVVAVGTIPVGMALFGDGPVASGVAAASPFWGVGYSAALFGGLEKSGPAPGEHAAWLALWIVAYGLIALGLLGATLGMFDRCLGRVAGPAGASRGAARIPHGPPAGMPVSDGHVWRS